MSGRLRLLLASSSVAALLIGSGASALAQCINDVANSAGPGPFTNTAANNCINIQNSSVTGSVTNAGPSGKLTTTGTGILVKNSTLGAAIINSGVINGPGGALNGIVVNNSVVPGGISNSGTISAFFGAINVNQNAVISNNIFNSGVIVVVGAAIDVSGVAIFGNSAGGGITNAGTISAPGHAFPNIGGAGIIVGNVSAFLGSISNNGTISAGAGISVGLVSTFSGGITNSGSISVAAGGISLSGVSAFAGNISNTGTLTAGGIAIEIDPVSTFSGAITNGAGATISAGQTGIFISRTNQFGSSLAGGISNAGTISAISQNAIVASAISTFAGGISNGGTISAAVKNGIDVQGISTFSGGLTNTGTITAGRGGIEVSGVSAFSGDISNGGTISAGNGPAILSAGIVMQNVSTFSGSISNSGTISGATGILVTNSGAVSVFDSGTIVGALGSAVDLSGNAAGNTFTLGAGYSIAGNVLGQGADTFQLGGSAAGAFNLSNIGAQYTGFTTFNVASGTWTVTGSTAQNWTIMPAGMLLIGSNSASIGNITDNGAFGFAQSGAFTFGNVISGTGVVEQLGPGTTTLTGVNLYSGGTIVTDGILAVSLDTNLGNAVGGLMFGGGTLQFLSGFTTARSVALNAGGGTLDTDGNNATLSGSIGGSGGLTKVGLGTLTLSGTSNYTGPTAIDAGTLLADSPGALAPLSTFTVAPGATLALNGFNETIASLAGGGNVTLGTATLTTGGNDASTTYSGTISGSGGLTKLGTGTLDLTGSNDYTGVTNINGGTLQVDGAITSSSVVNINAGGTLTGTGTVDPNVVTIATGAALIPGTPGVPGTSITIAGNLTFQSGALYQIYLNPTTSSFTNVTGSASLNGAVSASFANGSYISKVYKILTATSVTGTFNGLTTINLPANFTAALSYDAADAYLDLTLAFKPPSPPSAPNFMPLNVNQSNVANTLINYFNTTGGIPMAFGALSPAGLTAVDGENATGAEHGAIDLMNQFLNLMLDPYVDGRGAATGAGPLGFAPEQSDTPPSDVALAYASILKAPPQATFNQRWTAWGAGFGGSAATSGDPVVGSNNVTTSTFGYAAGMDYHYSSDTVLGFALAGGGTGWNLAQGLGTGRSDAFLSGLYGVTHQGPAYIAGSLAFANNWFTTNRVALGDQLNASFQGQSYAARLEGGYRFAVPAPSLPSPAIGGGSGWGAVGITPYAAIQAQNFHTPAYRETDLTAGTFGLSYAATNGTDTRGELGARFDDLTALDAMPLLLHARVAWTHDWAGNPALNAAFESLPGTSFTVNGAPIPHNAALTSAGAQLFFTPHWSFLAKFDGEFAKGAQTYAGSGTLRRTW